MRYYILIPVILGFTSLNDLILKYQVIDLAECEVYSYDPNSDADPFIEKGAL